MTPQDAATLAGGLGMFLLGIHHLTEGLKNLAGDSLRRALQVLVSGRWSGLASGVVFTALIQSSSAATLTIIGFVSAGLVTFPQAVAVIMGANLGTTATSWIVAVLGFKVRIAAAALPMLGAGALCILIGRGRLRAAGAVLAGFGLLFTGIEFLQTAMAAIQIDPAALAGHGAAAPWILAGVGAVMTVVMQSSSAAVATTLVALNAGGLTLDQACALVVGQNIGTTVNALMVMPGGSTAVRRTALCHILFNTLTAIIVLILIQPLTAAAVWCARSLQDPDGTLALAAFHTIFNLFGILLFFPWLGRFARMIEWLIGRENSSSSARLDRTLAAAGGTVALEAAWRALLETASHAIRTIPAAWNGAPADPAARHEARLRIHSFLGTLRPADSEAPETTERRTRLWHALDHLEQLEEDLAMPPFLPDPSSERAAPAALLRAMRALSRWAETPGSPHLSPDDTIMEELAAAAAELAQARRHGRDGTLAEIAAGRLSSQAGRTALDRLRWADGVVFHAWRLAESIRRAAAPNAQTTAEGVSLKPASQAAVSPVK